MVAGRETDALVAINVMGWKQYRGHYIQPYSTSIEAAWPVVEKMRELKFLVSVDAYADTYWCGLYHDTPEMNSVQAAYREADTAPLAICLAALSAVGVEVK